MSWELLGWLPTGSEPPGENKNIPLPFLPPLSLSLNGLKSTFFQAMHKHRLSVAQNEGVNMIMAKSGSLTEWRLYDLQNTRGRSVSHLSDINPGAGRDRSGCDEIDISRTCVKARICYIDAQIRDNRFLSRDVNR